MASTTPTMALLRPVDPTAPTMMPAAATATAMPIMLRAPETMPAWISVRPVRTRPGDGAARLRGPRSTTRRARMIAISETME